MVKSLKRDFLLFLILLKRGGLRKRFFLFHFLLTAATAFFEVGSFGLLIPVLHRVFYSEPLSGGKPLSFFLAWLDSAPFRTFEGLAFLIAAVCLASGARLICQYLNALLVTVETTQLQKNLRVRIFDHLIHLGTYYFDRAAAGRLGTLLMGASSDISKGLQLLAGWMTQAGLNLSYFALLFFFSWKIMLFTVVFSGIAAWITRGVGRRVFLASQRIFSGALHCGRLFFDLLSNIKLIQSFGREKQEVGRFENLEKENERRIIQGQIWSLAAKPLQEWIVTLSMALFLIAALKMVPFQQNPGQVIVLVMSLLIWRRSAQGIIQMTAGYTQFMNLRPSITALGELWNPEGKPRIESGSLVFPGLKGHLEFRGVSFAEIEKFLDTPIKYYSSGMYVRLAFAAAAHLEPEVLLVDEVLAVGDARFQKKCLAKMEEAAKRGRTILFVSHNMQTVKSITKRCLLLREGRLIREGDTASVVDDYLKN